MMIFDSLTFNKDLSTNEYEALMTKIIVIPQICDPV